MLSPIQKRRQKLGQKKYLEELSTLAGRVIQVTELSDPHDAVLMSDAARQKFLGKATAVWKTSFSDLTSNRFVNFLKNLHEKNPSSIYIWSSLTIDCGTFEIPSLDLIKFNFDLTLNDDGIIVFLTSDLSDRLLLDFSESCTGDEILLTIEAQGENWVSVQY